jgi:hypothetical protein
MVANLIGRHVKWLLANRILFNLSASSWCGVTIPTNEILCLNASINTILLNVGLGCDCIDWLVIASIGL